MRRIAWCVSALLMVPGAAALAYGQQSPRPALLVLSKQDRTLAVVDPANLKVVARIPVGDDPHEVIASPSGKTAYVSNYGFGAFHTLAVIDLDARKPLEPIDLGALHGPHGLAFSQNKLWFTAEAAKAVGRYDPATRQIDLILGIGMNRDHMIYVSPDGRRIVTTDVNSGAVSILERFDGPAKGGPAPAGETPPGYPAGAILPPGGDWVPSVVKVGTRDEGFDVSPDGREVWVANAGEGTVSVIDIATRQVVATIDADAASANRLKFTPDGKQVLISRMNGTDLVIVDTATRKVVKRLPIGHGAAGIQMQPDGLRAYVSCSPDNYVAVIDLKTFEVVGQIDAGPNPDGLAWVAR